MISKDIQIAPVALERLMGSKISGEKIAQVMLEILEKAKKTGQIEIIVIDYADATDILEDTDLIPTITLGLRPIREI